jgi:hypothetical protein
MSEGPRGSRDSPRTENFSREPETETSQPRREPGGGEAGTPDPAIVHSWYTAEHYTDALRQVRATLKFRRQHTPPGHIG